METFLLWLPRQGLVVAEVEGGVVAMGGMDQGYSVLSTVEVTLHYSNGRLLRN